jgi:hypothetical protein
MKTLLAGLTILVIGDSHLAQPGYLLTTLHDALAREGAVVHTYGACGVAAGDWMRQRRSPCGGAVRLGDEPARIVPGTSATTTPFPELQRELRPDLVVVVMGDTMADYGKPALPKAWIWNQVTALTRGIRESGTRCFWVGPAWGSEGGKYGKTYARVSELSGYLADIVAPCAYVDSTQLAKPGEWRTIDGQHFTPTGYRAWGDAIAAAIAGRGS